MAPFKSKQRAIAEIQLAQKNDEWNAPSNVNDHFLSDETIRGTAVFKLPSDINYSHCEIALRGVVKTTTEDTHTGAFAKGWRHEKLPFLGVSYRRKAQPGDKDTVRVPFHFDLVECEKLAAFKCALPPSLDSRHEGQRANGPQYEVVYTITVTAFANKEKLAAASQHVYILPTLPVDVWNLSGEYFWAELCLPAKPKLNRAGSNKSASSAFSVDVRRELAGQEPDPIVMHKEHGWSEGSTEIPFIVKISHENADAAKSDPLPTHVQVKAQLVSKTHMTPDEIKQLGSDLEYTRAVGDHFTRTTTCYEQSNVVEISKWESCVSSCLTDPFSVARFSFPFSIHEEESPAPSFFTPILSRKYSLDLTVAFSDGRGEKYKLSLPVEISHGIADSSDDEKRKDSDASSSEVVAARA